MPEERKRGISEEVCKTGVQDSDAATVRCVCICKQEVNKRGNPGGLKEGCWNDCSFRSPPGCLSSTDERTAAFRKPLLAALSFFRPGWVENFATHPSGRQTFMSPERTVTRRASSSVERRHLERRGVKEQWKKKKKLTHAESSSINRWARPGWLQPGQAGRLKGGP